MQTVAFKAGDTIISEGEEGDTAFFIVTGSVEVLIGQGRQAPGPSGRWEPAKSSAKCV